METFQRHEIFEMELLSLLHKSKLLHPLIFGGGTMLRLCHELPRYSTDLDFYLRESKSQDRLYLSLEKILSLYYEITDNALKYNTLLFELRTAHFPMRLKIEINLRRQIERFEQTIAWSPFATMQVLVNSIPLEDMLTMKIDAFQDRAEVRDLHDIEFLLRKGLRLPGEHELLKKLQRGIAEMSRQDIQVKLGSLLEASQREYYRKQGFRFLNEKITEALDLLK
jgi:predicted nucleotidyltransferase component of viral defense system